MRRRIVTEKAGGEHAGQAELRRWEYGCQTAGHGPDENLFRKVANRRNGCTIVAVFEAKRRSRMTKKIVWARMPKRNYFTTWALALTAVFCVCLPRLCGQTFAPDVTGVWIGAKKEAWNPATGKIGNMGKAGVKYNIAAAPATAQGGAAAAQAAANSAFQFWNKYSAIPTVGINFVSAAAAGAEVPVSWGVTPS